MKRVGRLWPTSVWLPWNYVSNCRLQTRTQRTACAGGVQSQPAAAARPPALQVSVPMMYYLYTVVNR